jgi:hypothetical protein
VAFGSDATNLVSPDTNLGVDFFVRDRLLGTTERVSVNSNGEQGNITCSVGVSISADGRFVAFLSQATNLVAGDTNDSPDVFVRDRQNGTTLCASVGLDGLPGEWGGLSPSISADGHYVTFSSASANLVPGDVNNVDDIFVRDLWSGTTERVSLATDGTPGDGNSATPWISGNGCYVTFQSFASNLVAGDDIGSSDIFVRDRETGTTQRVSISTAGAAGNDWSGWPSISDDGRFVDFVSNSTNLVLEDANYAADIFLRDMAAAGFTSLCDPGSAGVADCPCSNPPSGPGRGCDNSSATGGAVLLASGIGYLAMDSLLFTTSGEKPNPLSILMQGNAAFPGGTTFGQGLRCLGGTIIRRLFIRFASGGSVTFPDHAAGDPSVSARSSSLGDPIHAGESRWYLVYYRDPLPLGACPAWATFNATQTGQVSWSP